MENSLFSKCNIVIMNELEFDKFVKIKLPFYFHIKDVSGQFFDTETENVVEYYSKETNEQYDEDKEIEKNIQFLKYVDLNKFIIEDLDEECEQQWFLKVKNGYIFKNHRYLHSFLIKYLYFNEIDFYCIERFVINNQIKLVKKFCKMIETEMGLGHKKEDVSESFMVLRGAFELCSPPIFPENKGKTISEYSFRELRTQRVYLSRKCEIEKAYQDEILKNSKKPKK